MGFKKYLFKTNEKIKILTLLGIKSTEFKALSFEIKFAIRNQPVFRLKQDAVPGRVITGHFKPILTGEWDIQCAEMCGVAHGIMGARIFIKSEAEHKDWLAANTPIIREESLDELARQIGKEK